MLILDSTMLKPRDPAAARSFNLSLLMRILTGCSSPSINPPSGSILDQAPQSTPRGSADASLMPRLKPGGAQQAANIRDASTFPSPETSGSGSAFYR